MVSVHPHDVVGVRRLLERVIGRYAKDPSTGPYISALYRQTVDRTFSGTTKRDDIKESTTNQFAVLFLYKARDRKPVYKVAYDINERCLIRSLDQLITSAQRAKTTDYHLEPRPPLTAALDLNYRSYPLRAQEYHPILHDILASIVTKQTKGALDLGLQFDQEVFVDSEGNNLTQRIPRFCLTLDYTAYSARDRFKLRRRVGGAGDIAHLHCIARQLTNASEEHTETAHRFLRAPDHYGTFHLRSGRYPVILSGDVTTVALEEFFAHQVEATDRRVKPTFSTMLCIPHEPLAHPEATIINDPRLLIEGMPSHAYHQYDAEGCPTGSKTLLNQGKLQAHLGTRLDHAYLEDVLVDPGNARIGDFTTKSNKNLKPESRQAGLFMQPGTTSLTQMKKAVAGQGLFVTGVPYGETRDYLQAGSVLELNEVYYVNSKGDLLPLRIKSGHVNLISTVADFLHNIKRVGDTASSGTGWCGAPKSGLVPSAARAPALLVSPLTVNVIAKNHIR